MSCEQRGSRLKQQEDTGPWLDGRILPLGQTTEHGFHAVLVNDEWCV